ncbi:PAS domain S-box-containing protein [Micromonospora pattaloongensis]|uniref:PAS domain S-box-containing protein n=1 Tax=Micromonospora pattaloongensis TaxID=405436 RepID=A0A1H3S5P5_9ACTN|nr:PAS domain-containing protein [Micromonospora pattaloongensis]SDZ32905.1 PAS domain S-box-containing protein [Micromonospora pattaloongensis]
MRATLVRPTGVERTFDEDEIIVSKTDTRGVITYANDVFLRVSVYDEADVIGQPHNVIRHPDMPRCVFKLLWDTLKDRREIFAYIVNLASDGGHYWVLAHVTPSFDAGGRVVGYHSNRRRPNRDAVTAASALYARLAAEERRHARPADAIEASSRMLQDLLDERGQSYEEFVWDLTNGSAA